ncbi:MAG: hypothetical protein ABW318_11300 [Vicinamibacterales bacterium]
MPAPRRAELWARRTPASFVFDLKGVLDLHPASDAPPMLPKDIQ